jgi:Na+-transporting methylmalonyl-CoA/oxaloacetate decarboxylase gamma subunit
MLCFFLSCLLAFFLACLAVARHGPPSPAPRPPRKISRTNLETLEEEEEKIIIIVNIIISAHHQQTKIFFQVTFRLDWLITDRLPTTEHLFISS